MLAMTAVYCAGYHVVVFFDHVVLSRINTVRICRFAVAGWSLPAGAFALYTAANLAPRAYWVIEPLLILYPHKVQVLEVDYSK